MIGFQPTENRETGFKKNITLVIPWEIQDENRLKTLIGSHIISDTRPTLILNQGTPRPVAAGSLKACWASCIAR
jgi:hypothetical protein